jgi:hypothetical protein
VKAYERLNASHPDLVEPWRERGVGLAMLGRSDEPCVASTKRYRLPPASRRPTTTRP